MNDSQKIIELEKLLLERETILKQKEEILDSMKNKIDEQESVHQHLLKEINLLKNDSLNLKVRNLSGSDDKVKDLEKELEDKEINFTKLLEKELDKQKELERELESKNLQYDNQHSNCLELGKTIENLSKKIKVLNQENYNLEYELAEHIFKNTLINISLNKDLLKLNIKYNGYGILIKKTLNNEFKILWINSQYKKFVNLDTIYNSILIKETNLLLKYLDNNNEENQVILPFNAELKIDFEDIGTGFASILELQKRKRNMKILERLREYCSFKKETHDKANKRYSQKNLYFIIPSIFITALSGIFSFLSTASSISTELSLIFSIFVGILASISTFMQSFSGAMDFGGKAEAHSVATEEYDLIVTSIKFEINSPNESLNNPIEFYDKIKNKILEIKQKCKYQVPHDIVRTYSSQTVNFELGRIRDELIREAANMKAEMMKNEIESKGTFHDIELGTIKKEFDFRIIIDEQ